ncbi:hypothetical protein [Sneathiella glossodoripedis]|uniref:hypothetical protein n=1 Tax=Sneathiella glossodoripedis TaxID=418853 RepID=UPI00046EE97C|nr:hypothetical protein [Sneathiella glossodoripedis]
MKILPRSVLVGISVTLLAACGTPVERENARTSEQAGTSKLSKEISKVEEAPEQTEASNVSEDDSKRDPVEISNIEPEPEFEVPPTSVLNGKTPEEIQAVFGKPVLLRKEEPAQIWQYLTTECALHIVFYATGDEEPVVTHVAMNDRVSANKVKQPKDCFKSQLQRVGFDRVKALS